jgi:LmbE family N-acetylglucosaminyl deacetylase
MIIDVRSELMNINTKIDFEIPDKQPIDVALKRTTHMAIVAHQDDLEIMAYDMISTCYKSKKKWFFGVVVTDGAKSSRQGRFEHLTDEEMKEIRKKEQIDAANLGKYGALAMLDYPSESIKKDPYEAILVIKDLIKRSKPQVIYTHNLADKHDTHIAVASLVIKAIRLLEIKDRPKILYGVEVWRSLDWLDDHDKIKLDTSRYPHLAKKLIQAFASQVDGGKRYDQATLGRRYANATYLSPHEVDQLSSIQYAMDLTPLIQDDSLDLKTFINQKIDKFHQDVSERMDRFK